MNAADKVSAIIVTTLVATSCSAHGVSGTYVARGQGFVEMLQITQSQEGQLLGSLASTTLKPNGSISQTTINIFGVADGHAITLVAKVPIPLSPGVNMAGTVDGGAITLTNSGGQETFAAGNSSDYQAAVQQLRAQGEAIQQRKELGDENAAVAELNRRLTDYASMIQSPKNIEAFTGFHATHVHAVELAQRQWTAEQKYPRTSFQAGQLQFAVGHTAFDLSLYDNNWSNVVAQGHDHLQQFDAAIAKSPCHQNPALPHCAGQSAAIQAYEAAKPIVLARIEDIASTLKSDAAIMKGLTDTALEYSSTK